MTIAANELRIGNKILSCFDRIETIRMILGHEGYKDREDIHEIYKHLIGVEECRNQYNLAEIKPIPLTEEILLKCGFVFGVELENFTKGKYKYVEIPLLNKPEYKLSAYFSNDCIFYFWEYEPIKYLHQLQNLYFALTGKELEINL